MSSSDPLTVMLVVPFVLMLLSVALLPMVTPRFWHPNRNKLLVSVALGLPVAGFFALRDPTALLTTGEEYLSFIVLLGALFLVSGGIVVEGNARATPQVNAGFLALGTVLASFIGTTGAAMLLIRPLLETNRERTRVKHTLVFYIILVANTGGCLTPLGDPPLFLGYLAGVPFTWFFGLFPAWAFTNGLLLTLYWLLDRRAYAREPASALAVDDMNTRPMRVRGWANLGLLLGVVLAVAFLGEKIAPYPTRDLVLAGLALTSWLVTPRALRAQNRFSFHPILEVAALFLGIFMTMIPALLLLRAHGGELGVESPASFFWATGGLSAFLDNTPTFAVFFSLAQAVGVPAGGTQVAATGVDAAVLEAISLGAVFMGALTYIGNAPNFMVKAIAEERGVKTPGFFAFFLLSAAVLVPVLGLVAWVFLG
jgi:Na+/H+ antiporter NhaD/arsenite permease-like protein